ncbi:sugar ABC transporter permease [Candidatus Haliotispira prima]|uniref:Sugar ABC transporter permease n=1 Tax=Candidatus Haliotispira prima TaxID=3034016 RepID=A0ABY8MFV2_9SPIO|nr:sugar ABC transporter permease [Candidatus Haliotispira prima]
MISRTIETGLLKKEKAMDKTNKLVFWGFLFPALFAFTMVLIVPFLMGLYYSLTDWSAIAGEPVHFVGLANYGGMFRDVQFLYSFGLTFVFAALSILFINFIALVLAILVTRKLPLKNFFRVGFFIPNLIGGLVLGFIWQFIYKSIVPEIGELLGWQSLEDLLILADANLALLGVIVAYTWQYAGYIMMIYIAALLNVPQELVEACDLDGAGFLQKFRHITFPLIAQAFTIASFLTLVSSFKQFDILIALSAGGPTTQFQGQTINSTELLALNIYDVAFKYNQMGQGQARAVIFFVILMAISLIQVQYNKKREVEM